MAKGRNANLATRAPSLIGDPRRPGSIEGGNVDSVIIAGELEVKKLSLLRPNDIVRAIAFRDDSNEAVIIADEHSAFNFTERVYFPYYYNPIIPQSKVLYFNGNTLLDVNEYTLNNEENTPTINNRFYKLNAVKWRPMFDSIANPQRQQMTGLGKVNTFFGDMALLVGEEKSNLDTTGNADPWGALLMFRPSMLGQTKNVDEDSSPLRRVEFFADPPDLANVELFDICWKDTFSPQDSIDQFSLGVAYAVGTQRVGTSHIPKAYKLVFRTGTLTSDMYQNETFGALAYDLNIESLVGDGILFGCDYDNENDILYVTGSRFENANTNQILAKYADRTMLWTDQSPKLAEKFNILSEGSGYLIQDSNAIRFVSNTANFITSNVKRGQALWVDITDYNALSPTYPMNAYQNGLFFVQKVASDRELILDKRMPNQQFIMPPIENFVISSLFHWGYLQTDIDADDTTIIIDAPTEMFGGAFAANVFGLAPGQIIYIDGEQIQLGAGAMANVAYETKNYQRFTFSNCIRGVNRTTPSPHEAAIDTGAGNFGAGYPITWSVRTVCVLCEERDYKVFTRLADAKMKQDETALFITGDSGFLTRHDILEDVYIDYRTRIPIPNIDFAKISFKPDANVSLIIANSLNMSSVYLMDSGDYLKRIEVPASGIINSVEYFADGLSAMIAGRGMFKMTKKVNVSIAEREPKTTPVRYMFANYPFNDTAEIDVMTGFRIISSDALAIDDLDNSTPMLFVKINGPIGDPVEGGEYAPSSVIGEFDLELRIYLAGRGDELSNPPNAAEPYIGYNIRKYYWRSVDIIDTRHNFNPTLFSPTFELPSTAVVLPPMHYSTFKLPPWAKYVAVDLINRTKYTEQITCNVTVGLQGGTK